jgi:hypothetical protein
MCDHETALAVIAKLLREVDAYRIMRSQVPYDGHRTFSAVEIAPYRSIPATISVLHDGQVKIACES